MSDHDISSTCFAIVGAGGLGGPLAYALAAAGAGELIVCDDDVVELSNLQRQVQFRTEDIGRPKVEALGEELERRGYPAARLDLFGDRFTADSAQRVLDRAAVLIDASDNFETKFAVNDLAVAHALPCVIAAVLRYGGQVLAVSPGETGCYRCLFEAPPDGHELRSCADAGVLGAAVAVIGGLAARAAIALATRAPLADSDPDTPVRGELYVYDDLRESPNPRRVRFHRRDGCTACASITGSERA